MLNVINNKNSFDEEIVCRITQLLNNFIDGININSHKLGHETSANAHFHLPVSRSIEQH